MIDASAELFAECGYGGTSVAQICERAGVNIASVNYHFGSKESLLRAVLQRTFAIANEQYPITGEFVEKMSAEQRICNHLEAMIRRCFDPGPGGQFDRIIVQLVSGREGVDDLLLEEVRGLQANFPPEVIAELIGTRDHETLTQACMNLLGLCVGSRILVPPMRLLFPEPPTPEQLDSFIERQIAFALGGLENLKAAAPK